MPRASSSTTKNKPKATVKPRAKTAAKKPAATRVKRAPSTTKKPAATRAAKPTARRTKAKPTTKPEQQTAQVVDEVTETVVQETVTKNRKAPTTFATTARQKKTRQMQLAIVAGLLTVGVGASAAVGFTDSGQIDVAQTIKERNERMATMVDVDGPVTVVPANVGNPELPDGGLIGIQPTAPAPLAAPVGATQTDATGTSTDAAASSTAATSTPDGTDQSDEPAEPVTTTPTVDGVVTHSATTTVHATTTDPESGL